MSESSENEPSKSETNENESSETESSETEQSKIFYSGVLCLSRQAITANSVVWTEPANLFSIKSRIGWPMSRVERTFSIGMRTGSAAHLESEKRR